jgi:hypothetical protein
MVPGAGMKWANLLLGHPEQYRDVVAGFLKKHL